MNPQDIILATSSISPSPFSTSTSAASSSTASSSQITLHDLSSSTLLHSLKPSNSLLNNVGLIPSKRGSGGGIFVVQEGKAVCNYWSWSKDQIQHRLHLPEKLSCFAVSPDSLWAAGGSFSGHLYLWSISSGTLLGSFDAHYRSILTLTFDSTSQLLISTSQDAGVEVWSVARLVDQDIALVNGLPEPFASLTGHALGVVCVGIGKGGGVNSRIWTGSLDGSIKIWSLNPPTLLTTFQLPPSSYPTALAIDPSERFFYAGTQTGDIHRIPLFRRRTQLGGGDEYESIGGGGADEPAIVLGVSPISLDVPITTLALTSNSTLLSGLASGLIHTHSLPSHTHLRTIHSHAGSPITHLSILPRPADLVGHLTLGANQGLEWTSVEVRPFERMKVPQGKGEGEIGIVLGKGDFSALNAFDIDDEEEDVSRTVVRRLEGVENSGKVAELEKEVEKLKGQLKRAKEINDEIWKGVVAAQ